MYTVNDDACLYWDTGIGCWNACPSTSINSTTY